MCLGKGPNTVLASVFSSKSIPLLRSEESQSLGFGQKLHRLGQSRGWLPYPPAMNIFTRTFFFSLDHRFGWTSSKNKRLSLFGYSNLKCMRLKWLINGVQRPNYQYVSAGVNIPAEVAWCIWGCWDLSGCASSPSLKASGGNYASTWKRKLPILKIYWGCLFEATDSCCGPGFSSLSRHFNHLLPTLWRGKKPPKIDDLYKGSEL